MITSSDYEEIEIRSRLYKLCEKSSEVQWCNTKKGMYGRGCKNTKSDPYRVSREGKLGEAAFGYRYNLGEPDWEYRYGGDKGDFFVSGYSINVKMSELIQIVNESGKYLGLPYDIYVMGEITIDDRLNKNAIITLYGFITNRYIKKLVKDNILRKEFGKGNWLNYRITKEMLLPLNKLEKWLNKNSKKVIVSNEETNILTSFFN